MVRELKGRMSGAGRKKTSRASVEIDFGMLNDLIGFNLRMAQNTMHRHYAKTAARLGVGQRQFAVLELIDSNPGVSQVGKIHNLVADVSNAHRGTHLLSRLL